MKKRLLTLSLAALITFFCQTPAISTVKTEVRFFETYYFYDQDMRLFGCTFCGCPPDTLIREDGAELVLDSISEYALGLRKVENGYVSVVITAVYYAPRVVPL